MLHPINTQTLDSINNEHEHQAALDAVALFMGNGVAEASPQEEEFLRLTALIEEYESQRYSAKAETDPIKAIKFRMEQLNLINKDVAPIFGGPTRASEYLNKKRPLTMKIIYNLHKYLQIPYELLIEDRDKLELSDKAKSKLQEALHLDLA